MSADVGVLIGVIEELRAQMAQLQGAVADLQGGPFEPTVEFEEQRVTGEGLPDGENDGDILVWVHGEDDRWEPASIDDGELDLEPEMELHENHLRFRVKKVKIEVDEGELKLVAGDYGDWVEVETTECPEEEES